MDLIGQQTARFLADKFYDKRKQGALELERTVRDLVSRQDFVKAQRIVDHIAADYIANQQNVNMRNGGLIAMAVFIAFCMFYQ